MRRTLANRRQFLSDVGRSMLVAGIGYSAARDLGVGLAFADEAAAARLSFGPQERLAALIQATPPEKILGELVGLINSGTELRDLVGGAALANARAFGGEDYIGFHTFMALMPSLRMANAMPTERRALPVLKVLYRNSSNLHKTGKCSEDTLHPVASTGEAPSSPTEAIRQAVHNRDNAAGELILAGLDRDAAFNALLPTVSESPEVHRIVLAHRAWDMANIIGMEHATAMLRQSLRYCVKQEEGRQKHNSGIPEMLAGVLDQHKLAGRSLGTKVAEDAWILELTATLLKASPQEGAGAIAAAIAEGYSPESISEAICLTANELTLRDEGRPEKWASDNKPIGSVHGDSIGVHASDAANAWRHIVQVSNPLNAMCSLIISGWHVSRDATNNPDLVDGERRPVADELAKVASSDPATLLSELDGAIREKNQDRVCAVTHKYLDLGQSERPVFDLLLRYATSEDGALHAEKYFWTVNDEYALMRPAWRNRQIVALARVTSSEYGYPAPGYAEACGLLGCDA
jgi:hypothetical protein